MADLMCINCGEPWDMDYVLHEEPAEFHRVGAAIKRCPACPVHMRRDETITSRSHRAAYAEIAELLGDDIDGVVSLAEDFGLWN